MPKRFWLSVVVLFVLSMGMDFVIHGVLLHASYTQLPNLMRTEADSQRYFGWMFLAHALVAASMAWIYARGREEKPFLPQGIRFGLAIGGLAIVPTYLIYYVVQPLPGMLVIQQIVYSLVAVVLQGIAVAWLQR